MAARVPERVTVPPTLQDWGCALIVRLVASGPAGGVTVTIAGGLIAEVYSRFPEETALK
ncbi:MAG: hypothetical protein A4E38_00318 [Methanoregulaceae archaeon PtaB.Bin108]|nr:MAG: hypothetical protein A4E38_00318 [Methanoregulaceae archaeon PtaB.Bin108]